MSSFAAMWSPVLFGAVLFLSSALLFVVQPMVGKTLLPHLGGNMLAWNACLVFFQATLLAGYLYANLLHRFRGLRWQPVLQLLLMAVAVFLCFAGVFGDRLLVSLAPRLESLDTWPILSALSLLIIVMGLPFLVLSAVSPLVQRWFSHLDHPNSSDPYFLLVASNLGGLLGLIVYTLMIEPFTPLYAQWMSWKLAATALGLLVFLTALCAWLSPRNVELEPKEKRVDPTTPLVPVLVGRGPATWKRCFYWLFASALPVGLMMGVTNYLTLDLAPAVIFWTVPFALYLIAFCQAFARFSPLDHGPFALRLSLHILLGVVLFAVFAILLIVVQNERVGNEPGGLTFLCGFFFVLMLLVPFVWLPVLQPLSALAVVFAHTNMFFADVQRLNSSALLLHLACFYWSARLCLGMLAKDRPAAPALPTYYTWIGLGGLCGGLFQLILAPWLFQSGYREYAFLTALACTLSPAWLPHGLSDWLLCRVLISKAKEPADNPLPHRIALGFDLVLPLMVACVAIGLFLLRGKLELNPGPLRDIPLILTLVLATGLFLRPLRFGLALTAVAAFGFIGLHSQEPGTLIASGRNAYGIMRVTESSMPIGGDNAGPRSYTERKLMQGTMLQGSCITEPPILLRYPTTYYHRGGPVSQVMRRLDWFGSHGLVGGHEIDPPPFRMLENPGNAKADARIVASLIGVGANPFGGGTEQLVTAWSEPPYAYVGLGTGTLHTYANPFQWVDAYELDPAIIALSTQEPPVFHYVQSARKRGVGGQIITGDARRNLSKAGREGFYHVLFVDAFNSNAIPVHLLTQEAIELYFQKLAPEGVVCFHVTNSNLDLPMVLERIARQLNISVREIEVKDENLRASFARPKWVVLARDDHVMRKWGFDGIGHGGRGDFSPRLLWTDDNASVLSAAGQGWPKLIYAMLTLILFFGMILGLIEIMLSMTTTRPPVAAKKSGGS